MGHVVQDRRQEFSVGTNASTTWILICINMLQKRAVRNTAESKHTLSICGVSLVACQFRLHVSSAIVDPVMLCR